MAYLIAMEKSAFESQTANNFIFHLPFSIVDLRVTRKFALSTVFVLWLASTLSRYVPLVEFTKAANVSQFCMHFTVVFYKIIHFL